MVYFEKETRQRFIVMLTVESSSTKRRRGRLGCSPGNGKNRKTDGKESVGET
jgi:hypothetical protein